MIGKLQTVVDRKTSFGDTFESVREFLAPIFRSRLRKLALFILGVYVFIAVAAPLLSPPLPHAYQTVTANGEELLLASPGSDAVLGTTAYGYSVIGQTIHSFRTSMIVGLLAATVTVVVGVNIGLISGYYGGKVESLLMGITDFVYGLPIYPFAIITIVVAGRGTLQIALVIGLVVWRSIARVTRSETLTLKERMYVKSAKASGTSNLRIMYSHILPNLLPLIVVYFVFGTVWGILLEAGLSFIGLGDPNAVSWGIMLHNAFNTGHFSQAWWWVLPPAFSLWIFIWALYVIARALEENTEIESSHMKG